MKTAIFFLILASSVFGQVDSSALRARFGAPLNREVYMVRPRIEMIVDYSPTSTHACRLELPGQAPMPADWPVGVGFNAKKAIDDLLTEIVPLSMRGKGGAGICTMSGINSMCSMDYENLSIVEPSGGGGRTAVIVKFKIAGCSGER